MNTQSKPTGLRTVLIITVMALLLIGGIGITGAAAQSAVPGDALYSVKTSIEQTRLSMAKDAGDRAQMKLSFAEQRLEEITVLVNEGRNREIKNAVLSFEASINGAIIELETVAEGDPARAAVLAKEITAALTRYAQTLSVLAANAPDGIKDDVIRALGSTQLAGSLDMTGDDNSNSNANANENGDDNSNDNANLNSNDNGDDLGDDNSNDNANLNSNDNGDDLGDDNSNDNANLNSNANGDDDGNDNDSMNANDNADDSSNSNTSMDDNSNTNTNADDSEDSNSNTAVDDNANTNNNDDDRGGDDNGGSNDNSSDDSGGSNDNGSDDSGGDDNGSNDNGSDDNSGKDGG